MSKIIQIKSLISQYKNSSAIAKNLLNMAIIKTSTYKNLVKTSKEKLDFTLDLINYHPIPWSNHTIEIAIGSNQGFCGNFNNNIKKIIQLKNCFIMGERAKKIFKHSGKAWDFDILIKHKFSNIRCFINSADIKEISVIDLKEFFTNNAAKKQDKLEEIDNHLTDELWYFAAKAFINYCNSLSLLSENKHRMITMKLAKDNTKSLIEELNIEYNKLRQQNITNEIILISSIFNNY